ncbi:hypothetical protein GCM10010339_26450 [Streptomyces alanosinicus]|uniref:Uncharacterized protein n=1 Tax=Streptomyces alanosinicus TaxID=68171 RepID=A0A918YFT3_9ACTN|nr:hypothetical protein GCM10010339_26450 [Streptomyces alanosinicus]
MPRIGLPAMPAKIEGTRGKLKRLVERGWLRVGLGEALAAALGGAAVEVDAVDQP